LSTADILPPGMAGLTLVFVEVQTLPHLCSFVGLRRVNSALLGEVDELVGTIIVKTSLFIKIGGVFLR